MTKRLFDFVVSFFGLLFCVPLFAAIGVAIKIDSKGPIFFRQERIGRNGERFRIYKFRTMVLDAHRYGSQITMKRDPRITVVGRFLRRHKLDELPQLINVLKGDMSIVGPRPEVPRYVERYTPEQRAALMVRPGLTDPASIRFRNEAELLKSAEDIEALYVQQIMPHKLQLNLQYIHHRSFWYDLYLIGATLRSLMGSGCHAELKGIF